MSDRNLMNAGRHYEVIRQRYAEVLIEVGSYTVLRRADAASSNGYRAMIGHKCPQMDRYHLRNGEKNPKCKSCGQPVPDEIWGLWNLICNDQRYKGGP
jgi:hypothetical protein